jgi:hypothetical protein
MRKTKKFTKHIEDFKCQHCGFEVIGNGYTNHCPKCLWSKHVDINPGDRSCKCNGMMKPISVESKRGEWIIVHQCMKCGIIKKNKASRFDDFAQILHIAELKSK